MLAPLLTESAGGESGERVQDFPIELLVEAGLCADALDRQVGRSRSQGTRAVDSAGWHSHELARSHDHLAVSEFHDEFPVYAEESLVGVWMVVPLELLRHDAHPDFMVIHLPKRAIVIALADCAAEGQRVQHRRCTHRTVGHAGCVGTAPALCQSILARHQ